MSMLTQGLTAADLWVGMNAKGLIRGDEHRCLFFWDEPRPRPILDMFIVAVVPCLVR